METKESLKVLVCGSVDEGKSTFLGRLFWDMNALKNDQILNLKTVSAARKNSKSQNDDEVDFSFLSDGLRAERDQKITIDLAYRYFKYNDRQFIFIDAPGHAEYLPAMTSGAYECDVALVVIDVTKKCIEPQTIKHMLILNFFEVKKIIFVINKMDDVSVNLNSFEKKKREIEDILKSNQITFDQFEFIPVSALTGLGVTKNIKGSKSQSVFESLAIYEKHNVDVTEFSVAVAKVCFINNQRIYCESLLGRYIPSQKNIFKHSNLHFSFDAQEAEVFSVNQLFIQNNNSEILNSDQITILGLKLNAFSGNQFIFKSEFLECKCSFVDYKVVNDLFFEAKIQLPQKTYFSSFNFSKRLGSALLIDPDAHQTVGICTYKISN